jgi:hypothetical protein
MRISNKSIPAIPLAIIVLALSVQACAPLMLSAQSGSGCRAADTVKVPEHLTYFRDLLTTTDPARVAVRDSLGLSKTTTSKINLVTKASTCTSAVTALNTQRGEPNIARQVWVYTLGSDFGVEDPALSVAPGEYHPIYLFTSRFVYKRTLAGI